MSYSHLGGKLNIWRSKIDICVKFWLTRKCQKFMFFHKISRLRIFLAKSSRFGGYIYQSKVPYESKGNLPEEN